MDSKTISRRLDALQQIAELKKPCKVVVTFTDGSSATTDPVGAIELCRKCGIGKIKALETDKPDYIGLICTLNAVYGGGY